MKWFLVMGVVLCTAFTSQPQIPVITLADLQQRTTQSQNDTTYVVNFWATWCKPCVEELPAFEQLHNESVGKNVKVLLVSLDFKKDIPTKLIPFISKRNLRPEVLLLNEANPAQWIDKVDNSWSGAIPATLILNPYRHSRHFVEGQLHKHELDSLISLIHSH